ncbi:MAG TPA: alpha/beta hydrolase [Candidatus Acidoferrales bacterium]|jgi:acetyl esterase/lipase|nr:alpha/beta hydrolase [Candidatus Acidoferrales bacterium]
MIPQNNPKAARAGAAVITGLLLAAAVLPAQTNVVMLWTSGAPGSESWTQKEAEYTFGNPALKAVRNVVKPSITVYLPSAETATGTSVVVAPGGAFRMLSWDSEGRLVADWLQRHGVAAFVLKYRLTDTGTDEEFAQSQASAAAGRGGAVGTRGAGRGATGGTAGRVAGGPDPQTQIRTMAAGDGLRAIEVVRQHAAEWRLDPAHVGIMGFSAGGYVAVQAALDHTAANRPAFVAAIYTCCENAPELKIPEDAPPIFFLHAYNDPVSASSPSLFLAWKAANKPAELHTYSAGGMASACPNTTSPPTIGSNASATGSGTRN